MATNPPSGDGHRNGMVRDRSQVFNPKTDNATNTPYVAVGNRRADETQLAVVHAGLSYKFGSY